MDFELNGKTIQLWTHTEMPNTFPHADDPRVVICEVCGRESLRYWSDSGGDRNLQAIVGCGHYDPYTDEISRQERRRK